LGCRTASIQSQPTITTAERIDELEKSGSATRCRLPNPIDLELVIERNGVQQPGNINKDKVAGTDCSGTARPLETALECKLEVFSCFFFCLFFLCFNIHAPKKIIIIKIIIIIIVIIQLLK